MDWFTLPWGTYWYDFILLAIWAIMAISLVWYTIRKYDLSFVPVRPLILLFLAYWITGMFFGGLFSAIWYFDNSSFELACKPSNWEFTYYSFASLTTLGPSNITPVGFLAKWLTLASAIFGLFYFSYLLQYL